MEKSRPSKTRATEKALGTDKDGDTFKQDQEYATIVGILMYISTNIRPDIILQFINVQDLFMLKSSLMS